MKSLTIALTSICLGAALLAGQGTAAGNEARRHSGGVPQISSWRHPPRGYRYYDSYSSEVAARRACRSLQRQGYLTYMEYSYGQWDVYVR
jgi:hypothetical protein